jgi:hypothetical protein
VLLEDQQNLEVLMVLEDLQDQELEEMDLRDQVGLQALVHLVVLEDLLDLEYPKQISPNRKYFLRV